jgi:hypothetical protein
MAFRRQVFISATTSIEELIKLVVDASERELALVAAAGAAVLKSEFNLRMLKFYAEEEGKELSIASADPDLLKLARRFGFTTAETQAPIAQNTFDTVVSTGNVPAKHSATNYHSRQRSRLHLKWTIPAILILALGAWWMFHSRAVVMVYPREEILEVNTEATLAPSFDREDIAAGVIGGRSAEEIRRLTIQTATSGKKLVGFTPATGRVTFLNSSEQAVVISKGTLLAGKNQVRFMTTVAVTVPKAAPRIWFGMHAGIDSGQAVAPVIAMTQGSIGNQPVKGINRFAEGRIAKIEVVNTIALTNGADRPERVVAPEDITRGEEEARRQMDLAGAEEIKAMAGAAEIFLPELAKLDIVRIDSQPLPGNMAEQLETVLEYRMTALLASKDSLRKLLADRFDQRIPTGFQIVTGSLDLLAATPIGENSETPRLLITGRGRVRGVLDRGRIRRLIAGKTVAEARALLTRERVIGDFRIRIKGSGDRLPRYGFQIKLILPAGARPR